MSNIYKSKVISIMAPMNKGNFFTNIKMKGPKATPTQNKTKQNNKT